jgi:CheY-like chemotaxis protein
VGTVLVTCALVKRNGDNATVKISVKDSGIGISEENIEKLFRPFTQADASITRKFGGTGLGLAISRNIVMLMNGNMEVESKLGEGSTFSFTLRMPVDPAGTQASGPDVPTDEDFANLKLEEKVILIAEDNPINQIILSELIAPSKVTVLLAENGEKAVKIARSEQVDLIFMDMQMPVMDGLQATKELRRFMDANALPIIAVTANAMKEEREEGFAHGMNEYITKPVNPKQIYNTLRTWLKKR